MFGHGSRTAGAALRSGGMRYLKQLAEKAKIRKRKRTVHIPAGINKRRLISSRRNPVEDQLIGSERRAVVIKGKKVLRGEKKKKSVKVPKELRAKINKVIASKKTAGYYQNTLIDVWSPGANPGNTQVVDLPTGASATFGGLFNPALILYAVDRIWDLRPKMAAPWGPLINDGALNAVPNLDRKTLQVEVTKQWWTFEVKNNTQRTQTITVWKCQPKGKQNVQHAGQAWSEGLTQAANDGTSAPPAPPVTALHIAPQLSSQFNSLFKGEKLEFILEPGQTHKFSIDGPRMIYDFKKYYNVDVYNRYQPFDISLIWVGMVDLVNGVAFSGRGAEVSTKNCIVESVYHCKVLMPDTVGWTNPIGGTGAPIIATPVPSDLRRPRYCIEQYESVAAYGVLTRVDEEMPQAAEVL